MPWVLDRFGQTAVIGGGLVLLGLPALGYGLSDALPPVLAMSALRGVGFAVLTVTGSATVALLVPPARLGAAIGVYGLGIALPMLLLLPASVPIADGLGFWAVFALGALPLARHPGGPALEPGGDPQPVARPAFRARTGRTRRRTPAGPGRRRPPRAGGTCSAGSARRWSSCSR